MADPIITNNDLGSVSLSVDATQNAVLITFTGADTYVEGTIMAVDSVSSKWVAFVKGGSTNENGIAKGVLLYDVVAAGAGDVSADIMISGQVKTERLVIDADGDASNVDQAVKDGLRDYKIVSIDTLQLAGLDNQ